MARYITHKEKLRRRRSPSLPPPTSLAYTALWASNVTDKTVRILQVPAEESVPEKRFNHFTVNHLSFSFIICFLCIFG